ncbi:MAG: GNAT family N-acetyltransferase, partial [Balneolaceae bacterium]
YESKYRKLIHFFVQNRFLKNEYVIGIGAPGRMQGVTLISIPYKSYTSSELDALKVKVWDELGDEAKSRYELFGSTCSQFDVDTPQLHLNMIGVRKECQSKGIGKLLLNHAHQLTFEDEEATGISLSTEVPQNVSLYEYFGYEITGSADVGGAFTTWNFFRPNG